MQRRGDIAKLKSMWEEGKASGAAVEADFDELRNEAREELAAIKKSSPRDFPGRQRPAPTSRPSIST
jgi:hypothetical protein